MYYDEWTGGVAEGLTALAGTWYCFIGGGEPYLREEWRRCGWGSEGERVVLVVQVSRQLYKLGAFVGEMAGEEEVISRLHLSGKTHEQHRIEAESYTSNRSVCSSSYPLHSPTVILGLMISGSFFKSAMAANGRPQLATRSTRRRLWAIVQST